MIHYGKTKAVAVLRDTCGSRVDIGQYLSNPELPPDITDSEGFPYQNIDIYLYITP